ncbi:MAG: two-component system OmpR family response regulator [Glaciecola sp.]|jgi:two-component system OmpR family response regulator|uniref:response regulator n=1 Tax=Congregibacter sp. TaxID=2744308 RepID=UPI0039E39C5E
MTDHKMHILIVDDDSDIRLSLARYLSRCGVRCTLAGNGKELDQMLYSSTPDLIVLDIMMPGENGLSICRRLQQTHRIPIILLTALTEETDRIVGLELGADDYLTKPFNPRELLARARSVLRRSQMLPRRVPSTRGIVEFAGWTFDVARKEIVGSNGASVRLSSGEHMLLVSLIEHEGLTLSREQLLDITRGRETQLFDRSVDNQVSRLRRKLEKDPKNPQIIVTDWGGGYRFGAECKWKE